MLVSLPSPQGLKASAVEVLDQSGLLVIRLHGTWIGANLGPLRECFGRVASSGQNVRLDLAEVIYVDSSFLGLLLLLYGACRKRTTV